MYNYIANRCDYEIRTDCLMLVKSLQIDVRNKRRQVSSDPRATGEGEGERKKRQTNVRTTLRRQWGSRVPGAFNATHLGRISVVEAPIRDSALRGHFMPPIASDTGTLSTTPGNRPESFCDRKTTERRARFNLRARRSRGRRVSLLLVAQSAPPVRRHVSIIVSTTTTTSFLVNQIRRLGATNLIGAKSNAR